MKTPKNVSKIVGQLKSMDKSIDLVAVRDLDSIIPANKTGLLQMVSGRTMGGARVSTEFSNVPMTIHEDVDEEGDDGTGSYELDNLNRKRFKCSVNVDVKHLQQFLSAFANMHSTLHIDLKKDGYAKLSLKQYDLDVSLILPNWSDS